MKPKLAVSWRVAERREEEEEEVVEVEVQRVWRWQAPEPHVIGGVSDWDRSEQVLSHPDWQAAPLHRSHVLVRDGGQVVTGCYSCNWPVSLLACCATHSAVGLV